MYAKNFIPDWEHRNTFDKSSLIVCKNDKKYLNLSRINKIDM